MKTSNTAKVWTAAISSMFLISCGGINYEGDAKPVGDKVTEIPMGELMVGRNAEIFSFDDYIFIIDPESDEATIFPFEQKTYRPLPTFGKSGPGPEELTRAGQLAYSPQRHELYVFDYGKNDVVSFNMDSVMAGKDPAPALKLKFSTGESFSDDYIHVNDTLGYSRIISPAPTRGFYQGIGTYNLSNGKAAPFERDPSMNKKNRSSFALSLKDGVIAEVANTQDLLIIYDLNGNVKKVFKGPQYSEDVRRDDSFFTNMTFAGDYIVCTYSGDKTGKNFYGHYLVVFDKDGNYKGSYDTGATVRNVQYNPARDELILRMDGDIMFGLLPMKELGL